MLTNADNPMLDAVRQTPTHFSLGWDAASPLMTKATDAKGVVICGMGGSAFPGDILRAGFGDIAPPIEVSRDYRAPRYHNRTLYIVSSFSGNTEETLSTLQDLIHAQQNVYVVTSGGRLGALASKHGLPLVILDKPSPTFQPRAASGMFVSAFAHILVKSGLLDGSTAFSRLMSCASAVSEAAAFEEAGSCFARRLVEKTPVFYATGVFVDAIAQVSKIKFNENSKIPSFFGAIPELNHNEMVGYTQRYEGFLPVIFRDPNGSPRMLKRVNITAATLRKFGVSVHIIDLEGSTDLEKAYRALLVMDYASIALASHFGIDPNPVAMVEDFKAELGQFDDA